MEHNVLRFRCAQNGQVFFVGFTRNDKSERFKIAAIQKMPSQDTEKEQKSSFSTPSQAQVQVNFEKQKREIQSSGILPEGIPSLNADFDIGDFSFAGWYCPYCGHTKKGDFPDFIRCGRCKELVCGSRTSLLPSGAEMFACYDECGKTGEIKGTIKSIKGIEAKKDNILPPPKKMLPPP
ncbi:MAG: hypothetical protein HFACDABA_02481 [Anaerolineales bacterium]|nr:hypothetical protein [Anaerolineales bacterium]